VSERKLDRNVGTDPKTGSGAGEAGDAPGRGSVPSEDGRIAELERERDEYLDSLRRLKAEFDNFRKRTEGERAAQAARAGESLVKELLPVLDDLERALVAAEERRACIAAGQSPAASAPEELEAQLEDGVRLVHRALADVLARAGLAEIETDGAFDPHVHEALLGQPVEGAEPGSVVEVLQKGYRLGDRVLRPARVVVAE
jgi:molecular chaperone GrpE